MDQIAKRELSIFHLAQIGTLNLIRIPHDQIEEREREKDGSKLVLSYTYEAVKLVWRTKKSLTKKQFA